MKAQFPELAAKLARIGLPQEGSSILPQVIAILL
jgi:hypothetical protein